MVDLFRKRLSPRIELVVARGRYGAFVLATNDFYVEQMIRESSPRVDDLGLDEPQSEGIWYWFGSFCGGSTERTMEGDYNSAELTGEYRRLSNLELDAFRLAHPLSGFVVLPPV